MTSSSESCSIAETTTLVRDLSRERMPSARPWRARLLLSVPDEVKTTSDGRKRPPMTRTRTARAPSRARAAILPVVCSELGLAPA
jgi:hypothetical protein